MAKTAFLEKNSSLRVLGIGFIVTMLLFVWLTYAFFNKKFEDSRPVTLTAGNTGMQLPSNADVKIKGMIVGRVDAQEPTDDGVLLRLAMEPESMELIPADVTARLIPKTLFGEKYVDLLPPEGGPTGETLQAGDNIDEAEVPIEVETLLNNLYPLLEAVQPAELSYTLTAISDALEGRGEEVGETIVTLSDYLEEFNPDVPMLVDDLIKFGEVADGYADAMPDLGRLLGNLTVTGDTIIAKEAQLQSFYVEGTKMSNTFNTFLDKNGDNIITLSREGQPFLQTVADYSGTIPCVTRGINDLIPDLATAFREGMLHINLEVLPPSNNPTGYSQGTDETPILPPREAFGSAGDPDCFDLPQNAGDPGPQFTPEEGNRGPIPPYSVYKATGIKCDHNKFTTNNSSGPSPEDPCPGSEGPESEAEVGSDDGESGLDGLGLPRTALGGQPLLQPGVALRESDRNFFKSLIGPSVGISGASVPDLGALLVGPILEGQGVRVSEAR